MIRAALRGLTTRGRSFLAAAAAATLSAFVLGERELLQVAALLAALPILAVIAVARTRYRLSCTRSVYPGRIQAGTVATVTLRLENLSRVPTGVLLLEEQLPIALGEPPRFVLDRLSSREWSTVDYPIRVDVRGRYEVGPLTVRLSDPFGLCELTRSFTRTERIIVTPPVTPLAAIPLDGVRSGGSPTLPRSTVAKGEDSATTREYRHGDDLRRVHWRSTARTGELMVRREEQPWESTGTLLLDARFSAHRGSGPASSLEWAVSAAASITIHLLRAGFDLHLVTDAGVDQPIPAKDGENLALGLLAEIEPSRLQGLGLALDRFRHERDQLLVAIVGLLTPEECSQLAAARSGGTAIAVLVDSTAWAGMPAGAKAEADRRYQDNVRRLGAAGWRVLPARPGARISTLWPTAGGRTDIGAAAPWSGGSSSEESAPSGGSARPTTGPPTNGTPTNGTPTNGTPTSGAPFRGGPGPFTSAPHGGAPGPVGSSPGPVGGAPGPVGGAPGPVGGAPGPVGGGRVNGQAGAPVPGRVPPSFEHPGLTWPPSDAPMPPPRNVPTQPGAPR